MILLNIFTSIFYSTPLLLLELLYIYYWQKAPFQKTKDKIKIQKNMLKKKKKLKKQTK